MSKNKPKNKKNKNTGSKVSELLEKSELGLIWVDKQTDVLQTMACQRCGNPISIHSDYKCRKCKLAHWFKLKQ